MTYSLWQSDQRLYSLGGRVRKSTTAEQKDWTAADMERLECLMEEAARRLAGSAIPEAGTQPGTTCIPRLLPGRKGIRERLRASDRRA
jgi:hypothetical protein